MATPPVAEAATPLDELLTSVALPQPAEERLLERVTSKPTPRTPES